MKSNITNKVGGLKGLLLSALVIAGGGALIYELAKEIGSEQETKFAEERIFETSITNGDLYLGSQLPFNEGVRDTVYFKATIPFTDEVKTRLGEVGEKYRFSSGIGPLFLENNQDTGRITGVVRITTVCGGGTGSGSFEEWARYVETGQRPDTSFS